MDEHEQVKTIGAYSGMVGKALDMFVDECMNTELDEHNIKDIKKDEHIIKKAQKVLDSGFVAKCEMETVLEKLKSCPEWLTADAHDYYEQKGRGALVIKRNKNGFDIDKSSFEYIPMDKIDYRPCRNTVQVYDPMKEYVIMIQGPLLPTHEIHRIIKTLPITTVVYERNKHGKLVEVKRIHGPYVTKSKSGLDFKAKEFDKPFKTIKKKKKN
jgi:hypothetical protein